MSRATPGGGTVIKKHQNFYGSVDVYDIDVSSVPNPHWLRTNIIAYHFTKLQTQYDSISNTDYQQVSTDIKTDRADKRGTPSAGASSRQQPSVSRVEEEGEYIKVHVKEEGEYINAIYKSTSDGKEEPPRTVRRLEEPPTPTRKKVVKKPNVWFADTSVIHAMVGFDDAAIGPAEQLLHSEVMLLPVCDYAMIEPTATGGGGGGGGGCPSVLNSGQHWSLLRVFLHRHQQGSGCPNIRITFRHLDSCGALNHRLAIGIVDLLKRFYSTPGNVPLGGTFEEKVSFIDETSYNSTTAAAMVYPQQANHHDCGAYVCLGASAYVTNFERGLFKENENRTICVDPDFESCGVTPQAAQQWRKDTFSELTSSS